MRTACLFKCCLLALNYMHVKMSVHTDTHANTHSTRETHHFKRRLVKGKWDEFMSSPSCGSVSKIREAFIPLKNHDGALGSHLRIEVIGSFQWLTPGTEMEDIRVQDSPYRPHLNVLKYKPSEKVKKGEKHTQCVCAIWYDQ